MNFLIDTHAPVWFLEGNNSLSKSNRQITADSQNNISVSIASIWELAVKISIGKITLTRTLSDVINQISFENIEILSITPQHALYVSTLPFHHRNPFDRLIIAQAIVENLNFISADAIVDSYLTGKSIKRIC